jgi:hypothetical protein
VGLEHFHNPTGGAIVKSFLQRFGSLVSGILHGFDRIRLRGSKRLLCAPGGFCDYLRQIDVPIWKYKFHARDTTIALCKAIETHAKKAGLYQYVNNGWQSKEELALAQAAAQKRKRGLIAVIGCVEPCQIMQVRRDVNTKNLEPRVEPGKCLHYYHYYLDPNFGLRYTRLQSWFPFTMHIGLNGRDWLAQQMTMAGVKYEKKDNSFTWVQDWHAAQCLLDNQLRTAWPALLDRWAHESHPWLVTLCQQRVPYYWSVQEAEFATDIVFRRPEDLQRLYPQMVHYSTSLLKSTDVLRFFGYHVTKAGRPREDFADEVVTTIKELVQGTCVKHRVAQNLLKMYDKFGQILRLENLLIDVRDFKVYRRREGHRDGPLEYLRLRKSVADFHRRAALGQTINERLADALATVEDKTPLGELVQGLGRPTKWKGRPVRGLNPLAPGDAALLQAINRGEFVVNGFRNRDLRALLFPATNEPAPEAAKSEAAKVTRLIRLLRAHGIISKVSKTHRYQVSADGRRKVAALLAAQQAGIEQLLKAA